MTIGNKIRLFIYLILEDIVNAFSDFYISNKIRYLFYKVYLSHLGENVIINSRNHFEVPGNIKVGNNCSINRDCWFSGGGGLNIGNDVLIGPKVVIHTANHNHNISNLPFRLQGHTFKAVTIKDNVWIGAGVIILPGVIIDGNTIIAAGSVVSKNIPSGVLAGGIPAKIIKVLKNE